MRNRILATGAVLFALSAAPAGAGGYDYGYDHGYYYDPGYHYSGVYQDPPPVGVLYKHYLPDAYDFVPRYYYAPRYVRYYHKSRHRHHSHDYESRYDRRDPEYCDRLYRNAVSTDSRYWWRRYDRRCGD